jgi:hypothetical protein
MKTKSKKEEELYIVYYLDLDDPDAFWEEEENYDCIEDAIEHVEDTNKRLMDDDNTKDWHWEMRIVKVMKWSRYTSKVNIQRTLLEEKDLKKPF